MKKGAIGLFLVAALLLSGCAAAWKQGEVVVVQEDKVTIHILAGQSTSDAGSEEMIEQALREQFPEVEFQWTCVDWGDGFASQVTSRFAAGQMPDILIGKAQDVPVYQALGAILPLEEEACAGISDDALELVRVDGQIYGLPYNVIYQGVLYNRTIFEELGLEVPTTREELAQTVRICEEAGYTAFGLHYGDVWSVGNLNMQFWMNDLFARYPRWSGSADFVSEPLAQDVFAQCRYMLEHSYSDAVQIAQTECIKRFAQGETAMFMTGTWSVQALTQLNPQLEVGLFPYPNTTGDAQLLEETNLTFMKGNSGKNDALVDEILRHIGTNEELALEIAEFTVANSTFKSLRGSETEKIDQLSEEFVDRGAVANVALGNNQFVWSFQNGLAEQTLKWMEGKLSWEELLTYADETLKVY